MNDKNLPPEIFAGLAPLWVFLISALGAVVAYFEDIKPEDPIKTRFFKVFTRMASSAFAGVLTWHAVRALGVPDAWHVPIVGIAGHMGVEALKLGGDILRMWLNKRAGADK